MLRALWAIVALGLVAGCAQNNPPAKERAAANVAKTPTGAVDEPVATVSAKPKKSAGGPTIPAGAQWTIYCQTVSGPAHVLQAKQIKETLQKSSGMPDWYVVHGEQESTIYYGYYGSSEAGTPDGKRARDERARIDALTDASGNRPFRYAIVVPLNAPDPLAPPEWDLRNAPPDRYWSLQIAAYKDSPQRKLAAVESVRDARAQGIEAYYHHGENVSHVCIGAWPREALREQEKDFQVFSDPSRPLLVLPPGLPDDVVGKVAGQLPGAENATRVMPKAQVVDPSLLAAMKQYPHHAVNWEFQYTKVRNPDTGEEEQVLEPSLIVVIPRRPPSILGDEVMVGGDGDGTSAGATPMTPEIVSPPRQQPAQRPAGTGRLKSIGG